jgi:hypothetical protein
MTVKKKERKKEILKGFWLARELKLMWIASISSSNFGIVDKTITYFVGMF